MKTLLFSLSLLLLVAGCRHQKAVTSSAPPKPENTNTQSTTIISNQGDVTISSDESTTATIEITNPPDTIVTSVVLPDTTQMIYRLKVSFISKGSGIDRETNESFEKWLDMQPKHPKYEKTHWGREGEIDYCLKLDELSTREQEIFIRDVRTQLTDKELVFVSEYSTCKGRK